MIRNDEAIICALITTNQRRLHLPRALICFSWRFLHLLSSYERILSFSSHFFFILSQLLTIEIPLAILQRLYKSFSYSYLPLTVIDISLSFASYGIKAEVYASPRKEINRHKSNDGCD